MIETQNNVEDAGHTGLYCTAGHAATILRVSIPTVHRMIARGELPAERYDGRKLRIAIDAVWHLAAQRRAARVESLPVAYVATLLDRTTRTVHRYVASGALKAHPAARRRITRESVEAFAAQRSGDTADADA